MSEQASLSGEKLESEPEQVFTPESESESEPADEREDRPEPRLTDFSENKSLSDYEQ